MSWKAQAACRDFPSDRIDAVFYVGRDDFAEAKTVCAGCPVIDDCRLAGRRERWGVWGGLSPTERGMRDDTNPPNQRTPRQCPVCATDLGHAHGNLVYCSDTCSNAGQIANNKRRKAKKETAA